MNENFLLMLGINIGFLTIPVNVANGLSEFILGRKWLKNRRLMVDRDSNLLILGN